MEFDFFIYLVVLVVFLYTKNRFDNLRDQISGLQAKLGAKNYQETQAAAATEQKTEPASLTQAVLEKPAEKPTIQTAGKDGDNLEFKLGGKIFTGIGVVAVLFAVGFFLRYAFENNLINEFGRVALGVGAGIILLAVGEITRKQYANYSQALTGGGLGVLYLSFYAAFSFYSLMAQPAAFLAMIFVTATGILLSLRQNSMALAMFAQLGGFLTPFLLNNGSNSPNVLFLYLILLDLAVLLLAFYKLWQKLMVVSFAGTVLVYFSWFTNFYTSAQFATAFGYLSLFFAIFLLIPFIQYYVKKSPENSWDLALTSFNALFYFAMSYSIIDPLHPDLTGFFAIALGAFYCLLSLTVEPGSARSSLFKHFLLSAGFVILAIAVPIQFHQKWVIIGWAAESLVFIATGFKMKFTFYRILGHCLFFATILRLVFGESNLAPDALPIFNIRFLSYGLVFAALAAAAYLYRRNKKELGTDERPLFSLLAMEGAFIGLIGASFEIHNFFGTYWYPILWVTGGLISGWLSFRLGSTGLRAVTYMTFAAAGFRLLTTDTIINVADYLPVFNTRVLAFVASAAVVRAFLSILRYRKAEISADEYNFFQPTLFLYFHLLALWVVSAEIISYTDKLALAQGGAADYDNLKNVLLSVVWTIYGAALLVAGIVKKTTYERFLAIGLLIAVIVKVFLVDTAKLDDLYRFYSFVTLGGILLLAGYLYYRYQDRIRMFVKGK